LLIASVWRQLPASHRRWIVVKALAVTAVINLLVNAAIAWLGVQSQETVPLWGVPLAETSTVWNVVGTLFLLPLITCVLVTAAVRRDVRLGSLASLSRLRAIYGWLAVLPPARFRRGVAFGAIAVGLLAPPLILILVASGFPELTKGQFVAYQAIFATLVGALVTPVIALYAMADPVEEPRVDSAS
jgi:hypothetical protein